MIEAKRRTLDEAARSYGTDKGGQYHGYAAQYERVLEPIREAGKRSAVVLWKAREL